VLSQWGRGRRRRHADLGGTRLLRPPDDGRHVLRLAVRVRPGVVPARPVP